MPVLDYDDFDIGFLTAGGLQVRVTSPAGESGLVPLQEQAIQDLSHELATATDPSVARDVATRLFQAVFPGEVAQLLETSMALADASGTGLRIRIRLDPGALPPDVPWEGLCHPARGPLGVSSTTTIVRHLNLPNPIQDLLIEPPLKVLVAISEPAGLSPVFGQSEVAALREALQSVGVTPEVLVDVTEDALLAAVRSPYDVIHFIGHGWSENGASGITLMDGQREPKQVSRDRLAEILQDSAARLVVLSSCHGIDDEESNPLAGTAQELVRHRVPAVLATKWLLTNEDGIQSTRHFYDALVKGFPVDAAAAEARRGLKSSADHLRWSATVLYCRALRTSLLEPADDDGVHDEMKLDDAARAAVEATILEPDVDPPPPLPARGLVLLSGEAGIGKRSLALARGAIAVRVGSAAGVHWVPHWRDLDSVAGVEDSVIVLSDWFGVASFERSDAEKQQEVLRRLSLRNCVILTTRPEVLEEALEQTRLAAVLPPPHELRRDAYSPARRLEILQRHAVLAHASNRLSRDQLLRLERALHSHDPEIHQALAAIALPEDARRFVEDLLPRVKDDDDLVHAARRVVDARGDAREWFAMLGSDPASRASARAFALSLALVGRCDRTEAWRWYRAVVARLRMLDPSLVPLPIALAVRECRPHVVVDDDVVMLQNDSGVVPSVIAELSTELIGELAPDIVSQVQATSRAKGRRADARLRERRRSVVAMMTEVARLDLDHARQFLEDVSASDDPALRQCAVEVLASSCTSRARLDAVWSLLHRWRLGWDKPGEANRRWTAMSALGRLAERRPAGALRAFMDLAATEDRSFRAALPKHARTAIELRTEDAPPLLRKLAGDGSPEVRQAAARLLRDLAASRPDFVGDVLRDWSTSVSPSVLETMHRACWLLGESLPTAASLLVRSLGEAPPELWIALADPVGNPAAEVRLLALRDVFERAATDSARWSGVVRALSILARRRAADVWELIEEWGRAASPALRCAAACAAHACSRAAPARAAAVLAPLYGDHDENVARAAVLPPLQPLPQAFLAELEAKAVFNARAERGAADGWFGAWTGAPVEPP